MRGCGFSLEQFYEAGIKKTDDTFHKSMVTIFYILCALRALLRPLRSHAHSPQKPIAMDSDENLLDLLLSNTPELQEFDDFMVCRLIVARPLAHLQCIRALTGTTSAHAFS